MQNALVAIERWEKLDRFTEPAGKIVLKLFPHGPWKDAVSGTWLGHPLHPLLTDAPIGLWLSSVALDLLGGEESGGASEKLLSLGIAAALPTAVTGLSDWVDSYGEEGEERRIGIVHALGNTIGLLFFGSSLAARRRGNRKKGILLSLAGMGAITASGFLGGHLSYRLGVGVDRTRFDTAPDEWTPLMHVSGLVDARPSRASANGLDVVIVKDGDTIYALANTCSHRGGPLNEGEVDLSSRSITCPWHGSEFDLRTGEIGRGPATAPQPTFETRVRNGRVEIRKATTAPDDVIVLDDEIRRQDVNERRAGTDS